jgi:pyruvate-ferredoxin/flavodoxin oxidoreductase
LEASITIQEMQSEAGAAGTVHGSLSAGALTTTFTASQGLLLMLPNMFKIAGEMLPCVFHIAARSLACQALSIFADHSDVMAARGTGFAMLASSNVQEAQDMAAIAHLATIEAKVPFLHFFDGFRTSHEIQKIETIEYDTLKSMFNMEAVEEFKKDALKPDSPYAKVGAEGPGVYFQGRETVNRFYDETPNIVKKYMDIFYQKTGRKYNLFEYAGHPNAEKIVIAMASATDTIDETVTYLASKGEKVGVVKIKLYRPFSIEDFIDAIPKSVKKIAVLDRTKEPGSIGEPLYLDVVCALKDTNIKIIGGRYGLSSKEFSPSMVKAVFNYLDNNGKHGFTVGINDDVTHLSIDVTEDIKSRPNDVTQSMFWGYGSDGTVSATKNTIKIVGDNTENYVQAYFAYDAKKSGGVTRSYIRIGKDKIKSTYIPTELDFISLHKPTYIGKYDILKGIKENGIFLMNTSYSKEEAFKHLTKEMQETIVNKKIQFYIVDAFKISQECGLGGKIINTIMQTAFFKLTKLLPEKDAIKYTKELIEKQFANTGKEIIEKNHKCVDNALNAIEKVEVNSIPKENEPIKKLIPDDAPAFAKDIIEPCMRFEDNKIPVSKMTLNGAVPTATTKFEKRGVTTAVPKWLNEKCIQCGQCSFVCPTASIRMKQIDPKNLAKAPDNFVVLDSKTKNDKGLKFRVQIYPEDCVGCNLCVTNCPTKALEMIPIEEARKSGERERESFFEELPDITEGTNEFTIKGSQFKQPLLEFPSSCAGCSETNYVKLLTQLFGENMIIANATGCSSIWGGTFPTIPYTQTKDGKGPAWANSLFEDNAEYGLGFRLAVDAIRKQLKKNIDKLLETGTTEGLKNALNKLLSVWNRTNEEARNAAGEVMKELPSALSCVYGESEPILKAINKDKDYLLNKSVWAIGGDGWAYDIGYGGLDHVLAQNKKINVLVLDTEAYSNTGGQASKATPFGASAKFASMGKETAKKNLGLMMMSYGNIYVASVSLGANKQQLLDVFKEAEEFDGPSIIIAYGPCIAHGITLSKSVDEQKRAVESGYWPLYRYNPDLMKAGKSPLVWESPQPKENYKEFVLGEMRYKTVEIQDKERAHSLIQKGEEDAKRRYVDIKREGGNQ